MKTVGILLGALILGFLGGIAGYRFGSWRAVRTESTSSTRAQRFELTDASGRVVSVWTVDQWGRPFLAMSGKWEARVFIGPLEFSDVVSNKPNETDAWGIRVLGADHSVSALLGTSTPLDTKKPNAFVELCNENRLQMKCWTRDPERESGD
jgi:hypothetical protein